PDMEKALIEGLTATGADVVRVGLGPTPMLYYSVYALGGAGGIMITGSHNPPDFNGFKMMLGKGPFYGEAIKCLGVLAAAGDFASGQGKVGEAPVIDRYVDRLMEAYPAGGRGLAVGWDAGNGATGEVVKRLTARLPGRHVVLFADIDGRFPNHHPDPTV